MTAISRRDFAKLGLGAVTLAAFGQGSAEVRASDMILRAIPSSGEKLPIIGLGTNRYGVGNDAEALLPLTASLARFAELGGSLVDTAPSYRNSESVLGRLIADLGIRRELFVATKVDRENRDDSGQQMQASLEKLAVKKFDLMQIHNLRGWRENLPLLNAWKAEDRTRYTGITTSRSSQYAQLEEILRKHDFDFVQINYSLEQREAADRLLPLAADRGMAVIINRAFGGGRIFGKLGGRPLPDWAAEFDCTSWAQFLLKYALSHPAATVAIPGMTKVHHVEDNMLAGTGRMPTAEHRRAMEDFYAALMRDAA